MENSKMELDSRGNAQIFFGRKDMACESSVVTDMEENFNCAISSYVKGIIVKSCRSIENEHLTEVTETKACISPAATEVGDQRFNNPKEAMYDQRTGESQNISITTGEKIKKETENNEKTDVSVSLDNVIQTNKEIKQKKVEEYLKAKMKRKEIKLMKKEEKRKAKEEKNKAKEEKKRRQKQKKETKKAEKQRRKLAKSERQRIKKILAENGFNLVEEDDEEDNRFRRFLNQLVSCFSFRNMKDKGDI